MGRSRSHSYCIRVNKESHREETLTLLISMFQFEMFVLGVLLLASLASSKPVADANYSFTDEGETLDPDYGCDVEVTLSDYNGRRFYEISCVPKPFRPFGNNNQSPYTCKTIYFDNTKFKLPEFPKKLATGCVLVKRPTAKNTLEV